MKRRVLLLSTGIAMAFSVIASTLSPEQALSRLEECRQDRLPAKAYVKPALKFSAFTNEGEASLYVFDRSDNNGYFVVSADDCVVPLLGYTDTGSFDPDNIPPALKYWLDAYGKQISYLRSWNLSPVKVGENLEHPEWDSIEPLIKTKWDQDAPYNDMCPLQNGIHCYTGCVATSMAQVMNYFKYPEIGEGMVSYMAKSLGKRLAMNLGKDPFDWDNMIDSYTSGEYTEAQGNAVAYLMKACGYSVQMDYTTNMSGAYSYRLKDAMVNNFKYDSGMEYIQRGSYSYDEWVEIVYENIKNVGPVIYDGTSPLDGGHSFVCDGYDGNGYFHFNWGWSGMSDGYFMLDALNPSSLGIGGGSIGGFNFNQGLLIGIQPPTGEQKNESPVAFQFGALYGEIDMNTLNLGVCDSPELGWGYMGNGNVNLSFGVIVENLDDPTQEVQYSINSRYNSIPFTYGQYIAFEGSNFYTVPLKNLDLEKNKRYKFTFASKDADDAAAEWTPVETTYGYSNYIILTKLGLSYEIENIPVAKFTVSDIEMLTTLYCGCPVNIKAKISNSSQLQLSQGVTFELYDMEGNECFTSDNFYMTLNPGESVDKEWVVSFYSTREQSVSSSTEFKLKVINLETRTYYEVDDMTVTMEKNPGKPTILSKLVVNNAMQNSSGVYEIVDNHDIDVTVTLRVGRGYFAYPVSVFIMEVDETGQYLLPIINQTFSEVPFLNKGDYVELNCKMDFPNPMSEKTYYMQTRYATDNSYVWMDNQTQIMFKLAGVEGVEIDNSNAPVKYYNLQGVEIANPEKGQLVIKRQGTSSEKMIVK